MGDFQQVILAVTQVFTVVNLSVIFGGLVLGMIVGCIPGLSVTLGIILLLPLTYSFPLRIQRSFPFWLYT